MNVSLDQSNPSYVLKSAILLYGGNSQIDLVTLHPVEVTDSGPVIKEGRPATKKGVLDMLDTLTEKVRPRPRVLESNVLAVSDDCLMWWEEAKPRRIAFKCKELGNRAAVVPQPPLLFMVANGKWFVFALPENKRPTGKTTICVSPYFNVWHSGQICVGSTKTPKKSQFTCPDAWTEAFFSSAFTHPNIREENQLVKYERGCFAFWKDMLDNKFQAFPTEVLVPTKTTVNDLLSSY